MAFSHVGLDWEKYIRIDERFMRPVDVPYLKGNYEKAREKLGWDPATKFKGLAEIMLKSDLERWEKWVKGEHFPWDAWNYPNEKRILSRKLKLDR